MTPIKNNSLEDSYERFYGPTVKLTSGGNTGPNIKSKKQSALERYEAEKAVRQKEFEEMYGNQGSYERKLIAERDIAERFNPGLKLRRNYDEKVIENLKSYYEGEEKKEAQNRANYNIAAPFRGAQGGTDADYKKWRNYQEVQQGTPRGQFLLMQRAAQIGGNVNSAEYKDVQQQLRNAQLNQGYNNLY